MTSVASDVDVEELINTAAHVGCDYPECGGEALWFWKAVCCNEVLLRCTPHHEEAFAIYVQVEEWRCGFCKQDPCPPPEYGKL